MWLNDDGTETISTPADSHDRRLRLLREFGGRGHDVVLPSKSSGPETGWRAPVVFASPHAGDIYPESFRRASALSLRDLRRNEDAFVDRLFACASELGAPFIRARFPRCFVDVNRAGDDLPPEWRDDVLEVAVGDVRGNMGGETGSAAYRSRLGLGVVPLIISENLAIYRHPPSVAEVRARIETLYRPYHQALALMLERTREAFGQALLIDCHSMPGHVQTRRKGGRPTRRADIVLGDAHGRACEPRHMQMVHEAWERRGYRVVRNHPYAGGHATLHYGQPDTGIGAVQIEINRDLYLNPATLAPKRGYDDLMADVRGVVGDVIAEMEAEARPLAAE